MVSVLVVEDELDLAKLIGFHLKQEGMTPRLVGGGVEALAELERDLPALVLLDLMLPDISGYEICRRMKAKERWSKIPIVFISACENEIDRVVAFEVGGSDYITKPFSLKELMLRVKAVLKWRMNQGDFVGLGALMVDVKRRRATLCGELIVLTDIELKLLEMILRGQGKVLTRSELLNGAWGDSAECLDRTVDVHLARLRRKLGAHACLLETVRGVGYRAASARG